MALKNVSKDTWIRTVVLVLALVNQTLQMFGVQTFPFTGEEVSSGITVTLTVVTTIWAWWKNNSFTGKAQEADRILKGDVDHD